MATLYFAKSVSDHIDPILPKYRRFVKREPIYFSCNDFFAVKEDPYNSSTRLKVSRSLMKTEYVELSDDDDDDADLNITKVSVNRQHPSTKHKHIQQGDIDFSSDDDFAPKKSRMPTNIQLESSIVRLSSPFSSPLNSDIESAPSSPYDSASHFDYDLYTTSMGDHYSILSPENISNNPSVRPSTTVPWHVTRSCSIIVDIRELPQVDDITYDCWSWDNLGTYVSVYDNAEGNWHRRKPKSDNTDKLKVANRTFKCSTDERLHKSIIATYPKGVSATKEGHRLANPFVLVSYQVSNSKSKSARDPLKNLLDKKHAEGDSSVIREIRHNDIVLFNDICAKQLANFCCNDNPSFLSPLCFDFSFDFGKKPTNFFVFIGTFRNTTLFTKGTKTCPVMLGPLLMCHTKGEPSQRRTCCATSLCRLARDWASIWKLSGRTERRAFTISVLRTSRMLFFCCALSIKEIMSVTTQKSIFWLYRRFQPTH